MFHEGVRSFILQNILLLVSEGLWWFISLENHQSKKEIIRENPVSHVVDQWPTVSVQMRQKKQLQPESQNHIEDTATIGSLGNSERVDYSQVPLPGM